MKTKDFKKTKGITLISLVVSIVVLLILAGVSIVTLTGDNGLLRQVQNAKEKTEVAEFREAVQLAYITAYSENVENGAYTVSIEELLGKLYIDHPEYDNSEKILDGAQGNISSIKAMWEGTEVNETNGVLISKSGTEKIDIVPVGSTGEGVTKFVVLDGKYYEIILNEKGVTLGEAQDSIQQSIITLEAQKLTGLDSVTVTTENKKVTLQAVNSTDTGTIKINYGIHEVTVKVEVKELYTVSFYKESGDSTTYAKKKVEPNQVIGNTNMPANPTKDNCMFIRWKVGEDTFNENTVINSNVSVYAAWEILGFEITHPANSAYISHFGKIVTGYTEMGNTTVDNTIWRLFYADNNYAYLIADNIGYATYSSLPGYGNSSISLLAQNLNPKFTSWSLQTNGELNNNIKGVAALMDTENWKNYKTSDAEWAVGAPTLEMFIASYNATHTETAVAAYTIVHPTETLSTTQLSCAVYDGSWITGYWLKKSTDNDYRTSVNGLGNTSSLDKAIYCKGAYINYWLASPSIYGNECIMYVDGSGALNWSTNESERIVRPLVSIQLSKVGLNGDNKTITITDNY